MIKEIKENIKFLYKNNEYQASLFMCYDYENRSLEELENFLCEEEKEQYRSILSPKRKISFLMGRYSAKKALAEFCDISKLSEIHISNGIFGQPIIHHKDIKNTQISISHTDKMAAAIAFREDFPMALDIEELNKKGIEFIESQLTEGEKDLLKRLDIEKNISYLIFWTAKEALGKVLKTGLTLAKSGFLAPHFFNYAEMIYASFSKIVPLTSFSS